MWCFYGLVGHTICLFWEGPTLGDNLRATHVLSWRLFFLSNASAAWHESQTTRINNFSWDLDSNLPCKALYICLDQHRPLVSAPTHVWQSVYSVSPIVFCWSHTYPYSLLSPFLPPTAPGIYLPAISIFRSCRRDVSSLQSLIDPPITLIGHRLTIRLLNDIPLHPCLMRPSSNQRQTHHTHARPIPTISPRCVLMLCE